MKVLEYNNGLATNAEVMQVLEDRGSDSTGDKALGTPSERKVHKYLLEQSGGLKVSRAALQQFYEAMKAFSLAKSEVAQIVNLRPTTQVEVHLIVEDCEERLEEDKIDSLLDVVEKFFPPKSNA